MAVVGLFAAKALTAFAIGRAGAVATSRFGKTNVREGPQAPDLSVQTCDWGHAIPTVYGRARLAGNVIWSSAVTVDPDAETMTISLAIGICRGPVTGLERIWINGDLVFDAVLPLPEGTPGSELANLIAGLNYTFYLGDETQDVDDKVASVPSEATFTEVNSITRQDPPEPPESMDGLWYVPDGASGEWALRVHQLAYYNLAGWQFSLVETNMIIQCVDDGKRYSYDGTNWVEVGEWDPAVEPAADGPAYRGLCYVVFPDFPLHLTGGNMPQFEFKISNLVSSAPYTEVDEQTELGWQEPPEGEGTFVGNLLSMTRFDAGILESSVYTGGVSIGTDGLDVAPSGITAYWYVPAVPGSSVQANPYGNVLMKVMTAPASTSTVAQISDSSPTRLKLTPGLILQVTKSDGTLIAHMEAPLLLGEWYRIHFGSHVAESGLSVEGVDGIVDSHFDTAAAKYLILGSDTYVADYHVVFRAAALTAGHALPRYWQIDAVPVTGAFSGLAVIASSGVSPYWGNGSTDEEVMTDLLNRTGGWDGAHNPPNPPNDAEEVGNALRSTAAASFVGNVSSLALSLPTYALSRFYGVQVALTCRVYASGSFTVDVVNIPETADRTYGAAGTGSYQGNKFRREASCYTGGVGYWTAAEVEAIGLHAHAAGSESHVFSFTAYVLHSGVPLIEHANLVEPGTAVDMNEAGESGKAAGGGGCNVVLSAEEHLLVFMEWGHWYVYAPATGIVYATGEFLQDAAPGETADPEIPPLGCDFDVDEDDVIYTAKIGEPSVVYDHYDYSTMDEGDSTRTVWPLTVDVFVNGETVQSSDFTIPEESGHYLDLDIDVKVDDVLCDAGHNPYTYDAEANAIVFDDAPPGGSTIKVAWGFNRTLPADSSVVRLDILSTSVAENTDSGWADWDVYYPCRIRVGRFSDAPVFVMCAVNADSDPGSIIRIRRRTEFLWGIYPETTVSPSAGMLFRCMTIDDVSDWLFAVCTDEVGGVDLVVAMLDYDDLADPVSFDVSDYIEAPEVIMVWSSQSSGAADRIAIGQKGASEKICFWSFELESDDLVITYLGQLGGEVVPSQATSAWRRGASGNVPELVYAYDRGGPTVVRSINLTSRSSGKEWFVLAEEEDGGALPDFRGGSVYSSVYNGVFSGCVPVDSADEYSYIWIALQVLVASPEVLSTVVADICERAGLTAGQIDASDLTETIHGYVLDNEMEARSAIAPLADAYGFDGVESEGKIKFKKRTGISVVSIPASELAAYAEGTERPQDMVTTMTDEVAIPSSVELAFIDFQADYASGLVRSKRSEGGSGQKLPISLPIALAKAEAQSLTDRQLVLAWLESIGYKFSLTRRYAYLDPSDVMDVTTPSGLVLVVRIETMTPSGGVIEIEAVPESPITWE